MVIDRKLHLELSLKNSTLCPIVHASDSPAVAAVQAVYSRVMGAQWYADVDARGQSVGNFQRVCLHG